MNLHKNPNETSKLIFCEFRVYRLFLEAQEDTHCSLLTSRDEWWYYQRRLRRTALLAYFVMEREDRDIRGEALTQIIVWNSMPSTLQFACNAILKAHLVMNTATCMQASYRSEHFYLSIPLFTISKSFISWMMSRNRGVTEISCVSSRTQDHVTPT